MLQIFLFQYLLFFWTFYSSNNPENVYNSFQKYIKQTKNAFNIENNKNLTILAAENSALPNTGINCLLKCIKIENSCKKNQPCWA